MLHFPLNAIKYANMASQLRSPISGLFHVEEWGASTWKRLSFSQPHVSVFQPISTNQSTVLVNIWSNSACWMSYGIVMDCRKQLISHQNLFPKKNPPRFRLFWNFFETFPACFGQLAAISSPCGIWGRFFDFYDGNSSFLRYLVKHSSVGFISLSKRSVRVRIDRPLYFSRNRRGKLRRASGRTCMALSACVVLARVRTPVIHYRKT